MRRFSTLLILAGIVVILIPLVGTIYNHYVQENLYKEYLENMATVDAMTEELTTPVSPAAVVETPAAITPVVDTYNPTVLGRIKIPAISVNMLLIDGSSAKDLKLGAGHITGTAYPGQSGNCSIAGHRNYSFGSHFNRLDEVKVGDTITIEYNDAYLKYEVYEIVTVLPSETDVLKKSDEYDSILTLITCTPVRIATHRLVLHCKLVA